MSCEASSAVEGVWTDCGRVCQLEAEGSRASAEERATGSESNRVAATRRTGRGQPKPHQNERDCGKRRVKGGPKACVSPQGMVALVIEVSFQICGCSAKLANQTGCGVMSPLNFLH